MKPRWTHEKYFTKSVIKAASLFGWWSYHTHRSELSGPGFPDLVMLHPDHGIVYAELKMPKGKLTDHQKKWRDLLLSIDERWFLWRPSDWDDMLAFFQTGQWKK